MFRKEIKKYSSVYRCVWMETKKKTKVALIVTCVITCSCMTQTHSVPYIWSLYRETHRDQRNICTLSFHCSTFSFDFRSHGLVNFSCDIIRSYNEYSLSLDMSWIRKMIPGFCHTFPVTLIYKNVSSYIIHMNNLPSLLHVGHLLFSWFLPVQAITM